MLVHDIIKIQYTKEGYLPNFPYHLVSDKEMCRAFMNMDDTGYFYDNYSKMFQFNDILNTAYDNLVLAIQYHLNQLVNTTEDNYTLPDWVYTYMMGNVIGENSPILDIHDLIEPLGVDNLDDIFGIEQAMACYNVSKQWLLKTQEPETAIWNDIEINLRPPTMFGEPHVIKSIRLDQSDSIPGWRA